VYIVHSLESDLISHMFVSLSVCPSVLSFSAYVSLGKLSRKRSMRVWTTFDWLRTGSSEYYDESLASIEAG
jgi:hypothetical protein